VILDLLSDVGIAGVVEVKGLGAMRAFDFVHEEALFWSK
jgi:hypothetical protein